MIHLTWGYAWIGDIAVAAISPIQECVSYSAAAVTPGTTRS
jgi:hypothetical protein